MGGADWNGLLPWLAVVAAIAAAGAWLARAYALRRGLMDLPGERRSHSVPTPRGGGIGITLAWILSCGLFGLSGRIPAALALAAAAASLLVAAAGYVDDHRPLSPWWRLAAHVGAGILLAAGVLAVHGAPWLALAAIAAVPVLVNVWNFMDGIDGIAASQAALAALGLAGLATLSPHAAGGLAPAVAPALVLAAACIGFLPFNFPRARIFLGDVGSGTLGVALAVVVLLLLQGAGPGQAAGMLVLAVLPLSAFLIDAALTLGGRMVRREQWWTPHVSHAYQRLAGRVGWHVPVTLAYAGWTILAAIVAGAASAGGFAARLAVCAGILAAGTLAWRAARGAGAREQKDRPRG
ncbi:glycosyl transferase [Luteimonas sp. MC1895]|uniref:glycosyl transferase n=1 Tax=Luteimonas sp. MC1895 TaxID=2819513 RepID=UPI0018F0E824|nr:glycosyl transferase [Luteimonas sp. MC1895]MBJ6977910.1 glycosyl transferase [Luteimonas sp. MC1895]